MANNTPFAFHCMVCFEEFDPEERYPVVLPCGHTYVCNVCANRLDKCMECRTPLYTLVAVANNNHTPTTPQHQYNSHQAGRSSWSSARSRAHYYGEPMNSPPPQPPIKKRVPLPKNVVLLSLIEATELASEDVRKKYDDETDHADPANHDDNHTNNENDPPGTPSIPVLQSMGSMLDAADDEEERIKMSTSLAVGVAGTYAVAAKEGLEIFPNRPPQISNSTSGRASSTTAVDARDEDVDSLVKFYNATETIDDGTDDASTPNSRRSRGEHLKLCFGDRVQIVTFDGGWAKLARGYGYVKANSHQLLKVGGPVDRACRLEATLCSLSNRRKELRMEQSKIDNQFIRYMNDLQQSLQNDEDLTVILADTFSPLPDIPEFATVINNPDDEGTARDGDEQAEEEEEWDQQSFVLKPAPDRCSTPPLDGDRTSRFACFSGGMFQRCDSGLPGLVGGGSNERARIPQSDTATVANQLFPNASHPSPSAMRAGAQAWRERHGRSPAVASVDGNINLRTGLSGHMALLSSHANSHKYLDEPHRPSRMSSHAGLRVTMPSFHGILNSLTLQTVGSTSSSSVVRPSDPTMLRHNGSM